MSHLAILPDQNVAEAKDVPAVIADLAKVPEIKPVRLPGCRRLPIRMYAKRRTVNGVPNKQKVVKNPVDDVKPKVTPRGVNPVLPAHGNVKVRIVDGDRDPAGPVLKTSKN